jgi:hypothetical protein
LAYLLLWVDVFGMMPVVRVEMPPLKLGWVTGITPTTYKTISRSRPRKARHECAGSASSAKIWRIGSVLSYTNILPAMPLLLQSAEQPKHEQPFMRVFYGLSVAIRQVQGQHGQFRGALLTELGRARQTSVLSVLCASHCLSPPAWARRSRIACTGRAARKVRWSSWSWSRSSATPSITSRAL